MTNTAAVVVIPRDGQQPGQAGSADLVTADPHLIARLAAHGVGLAPVTGLTHHYRLDCPPPGPSLPERLAALGVLDERRISATYLRASEAQRRGHRLHHACGLDRPFPPENKPLWREFLDYPGAVLVSEFPFGTAASAPTLSKRNKTIVGLSHGALIGQATEGAMYAFRFAQEQHKAVATFAADGTAETSGNAVITRSSGTTFPVDHIDSQAWASWLDSLHPAQ